MLSLTNKEIRRKILQEMLKSKFQVGGSFYSLSLVMAGQKREAGVFAPDVPAHPRFARTVIRRGCPGQARA